MKRLIVIASVLILAGCQGPGMLSTVGNDIKTLLNDPAVRQTLKDWSATADVTNPELEFYLINGVGVKTSGVIVRGNVDGSKGVSAPAATGD